MNRSVFSLSATLVWVALASTAAAKTCPAVTGAKVGGKYPQVFEKAEFEKAKGCAMQFSQNPTIAKLNAKIKGNPSQLPAVEKRLPAEPLVVVPYEQTGRYGGVFDGVSKATESGTSDLLSLRHVNFVRFHDDLKTVVPNVAKSWQWNKDFTQLTLTLRKGHKWSDGAPFTANDVVFWYNDLLRNPKVIKKLDERFLAGGKPWMVKALDDTTVQINLAAPKPGLLTMFATDYAQPFQPAHVLKKVHPKYNKEAGKLATKMGLKDGYELLAYYYGQSDWKDVPTPINKAKDKISILTGAGLPATAPTLESFIVVKDDTDGRRLVANPYFFQVDTAGNQLPYINEISEVYIGDENIQTSKMIAGEVDYKAQSVNLPSAPVLLENKKKGNYRVSLRPQVGLVTLSFNVNDQNQELRELFNKKAFRQAMSVAMNRKKMNDVAFLKLGKPMQYTAIDPDTASFIPQSAVNAFTDYAPQKAKELLKTVGLTDKNKDGILELPSGKKLELTIQYTTQGTSTELMELVAADWTKVGVKTSLKEVTSDEYRNAQSANDLSVMVWTTGRPLAVMANNTTNLRPPFGSFFDLRNGMLWAQYIDTKGKEGVKPPASVVQLGELADKFEQQVLGSAASEKIGKQIVQNVVGDLYMIGTVKGVSPVYASNNLGNFVMPKTSSYDYYRMYSYLPTQWYFKNGK